MAADGKSERVKAWNQLGAAMGAAGEAANAISERNLALWSDIAHNLEKDPYSADEMSNDIARVVLTGIENLRDMWAAAATSPVGPTRVNPLPTVEIFVASDGAISAQPAAVPVSLSDDGSDVLEFSFTGADHATAETLKNLDFEYHNGMLTFTQLAIAQRPSPSLTEGLYTGLAYVPGDRASRPIAHLWVLVGQR